MRRRLAKTTHRLEPHLSPEQTLCDAGALIDEINDSVGASQMNKAGGIIGIIAGVLGVFAALATLLVGGAGAEFQANGASIVGGLGWGGVFFSFMSIVCGTMVFSEPKGAGIALVVTSILGAVLGGTTVATCMVLALIGGILATIGAKSSARSQAPVTQ